MCVCVVFVCGCTISVTITLCCFYGHTDDTGRYDFTGRDRRQQCASRRYSAVGSTARSEAGEAVISARTTCRPWSAKSLCTSTFTLINVYTNLVHFSSAITDRVKLSITLMMNHANTLLALGFLQMPQSPNFPPAHSTIHTPAAATTAAPAGGQAGSGGDGPGPATVHAPPIRPSHPSASFRALGSHLQPPHHPQHQHHHQHHQYNASPLQRTLTPPPPDPTGPNDPEPFPSIESAGSGQNFHISRSGLPTSASSNDNTSPRLYHTHPYQHSQSSSFGSRGDLLEIYCASCGRPTALKHAFACTECICAICTTCAGQLMGGPVVNVHPGTTATRRGCPRCGVVGGNWKRFQLDFR